MITLEEAIAQRHSVRQYTDKPIEAPVLTALYDEIENCNWEGGLSIQLVVDEPKAFSGLLAHYGRFRGVTNYLALVGTKRDNLEELCGYYGERLVLKAQQLGLNTCWAAVSYKKIPGAFSVKEGEKLTAVIALGYGKTQGSAHRSRKAAAVSRGGSDAPSWFWKGVEAALAAPTAMNQQQFRLTYEGGRVRAEAGIGFFSRLDLGIVKYHFETGAGKDSSVFI